MCVSGALVKNLLSNAGDTQDMGLIPGFGRSPGEGNDYPLQLVTTAMKLKDACSLEGML